MDYSQFLAMKQEIGLLVVFLLVFLYDTFMPKKAQGSAHCRHYRNGCTHHLGPMLLHARLGRIHLSFRRYVRNIPEISAIKTILNIGVIIVLVQSLKWVNGELMIMRRGEFFELLLVTLFGMYLMISARHFLVFVIGLESASLPLAAMVALDKTVTRATKLPSSTFLPPYSPLPCS